MNDAELLSAFEDCSLPLEKWTHHAHVRVAFLYASSNDLETATNRIRIGIKAYNKATQTPEAIDRGYHETMTCAFMRLVFTANAQTGPHASSEEFCDTHPELMTKLVLRDYYSSDQIMTWEAKTEFIEPDLAPLPDLGHDEAVSTPTIGKFRIVEELTSSQIEQLHQLIQQQWWGGQRSLHDVTVMVKHTSLMIGIVDPSTERLAGYCRVLTDFVFRATIYDVMVHQEVQGQGLGTRLLDELSRHPKLQQVSQI